MKFSIVLCITLLAFSAHAQEEVSVFSTDLNLYGTLLTPDEKTEKAILIIAGSGNTDRDGNTKSAGYTNNSLKLLAEGLTKAGYATLRYDKRAVGKSIHDSLSAADLRFEQYVEDVGKWVSFLNTKFKEVTVIGHSQGALLGMMAAQHNKVDRFISLAGLTDDLTTTLKRQMEAQPGFVKDAAFPILDSLRSGTKVDSVPPFLYQIFAPAIQDYLMSFMKYDPKKEISKLNIPVLVIQGTNDLQITVEGATALSSMDKNINLEIIEGMNHVLKESTMDINENMATYAKPDLPLHKDLLRTIIYFLNRF